MHNPEMKTTVVESITLVGTEWKNVTIMRSAYMSDPGVWALVANTEDGEPLAAFSVNLGQDPREGCVWIKTWSEGEGALEELERLGIVQRTGRKTPAGYSMAVEARVLGDLSETAVLS
jgi:hypothetical protein